MMCQYKGIFCTSPKGILSRRTPGSNPQQDEEDRARSASHPSGKVLRRPSTWISPVYPTIFIRTPAYGALLGCGQKLRCQYADGRHSKHVYCMIQRKFRESGSMVRGLPTAVGYISLQTASLLLAAAFRWQTYRFPGTRYSLLLITTCRTYQRRMRSARREGWMLKRNRSQIRGLVM